MATWKKVIVSGSNAELNQLNVFANQQISSSAADTFLSGAFSGSFEGTFVGTTNLPDLTQGSGIVPFTYDGATTATVAVSGAAQLSNNAITKWNSADGKFVDSSITDDGSVISGVSSIQLSGAASSLTGSFTGSFAGDGSGLTGVASVLNFSGSTGDGSVDLKTQVFSILGTANEIEAVASGQSVTIGLPDDVIITQDLTVNRNLTVLGTASFQNTENLEVADRFILLASGSNTAGDGGIVVQQGTQNVGELFAFDSAALRWGVTGSFDAGTSTYTPDAFMTLAIEGSGTDPDAVDARFDKKGNIFISSDETIWIYS
jgi:hypothetical protein